MVQLSYTSQEYGKIKRLFEKTMKDYYIHQLQRIQNPTLWQVFQWFVSILFHYPYGSRRLVFPDLLSSTVCVRSCQIQQPSGGEAATFLCARVWLAARFSTRRRTRTNTHKMYEHAHSWPQNPTQTAQHSSSHKQHQRPHPVPFLWLMGMKACYWNIRTRTGPSRSWSETLSLPTCWSLGPLISSYVLHTHTHMQMGLCRHHGVFRCWPGPPGPSGKQGQTFWSLEHLAQT